MHIHLISKTPTSHHCTFPFFLDYLLHTMSAAARHALHADETENKMSGERRLRGVNYRKSGSVCRRRRGYAEHDLLQSKERLVVWLGFDAPLQLPRFGLWSVLLERMSIPEWSEETLHRESGGKHRTGWDTGAKGHFRRSVTE